MRLLAPLTKNTIQIPFSCIKWYFRLPLTVPLSPTKISLNGPMVFNGNEWHTIGFCVRDLHMNNCTSPHHGHFVDTKVGVFAYRHCLINYVLIKYAESAFKDGIYEVTTANKIDTHISVNKAYTIYVGDVVIQ